MLSATFARYIICYKRLVKETNAALHRDLEFGYNPDGSIKYFKENGAKLDYIYSDGKLTQVAFGQLVLESYAYDSFGNPIKFRNETLEWERGTFLKKYGNIEYTYDINNKLIKKVGDRTHISYYDGDKLIAQKVGDKIIRYFYDDEGVAGFKIGTSDRYTFCKDAQGNILSLCGEKEVVAWYIYNVWGKCRVVDKNNNEITAWDNPAILNPFRWKSQLYDTDTKLYYIDGRWYDPMYGRFISAASPETLLQNAGNVFGLNLYNFSVNPVSIVLPCGSMHPSLDFYYDGEYNRWWNEWGKPLLIMLAMVAVIVVTCIAAYYTGGAGFEGGIEIAVALYKIAITTTVGTAVSLTVGGTIAGINGVKSGNGFWNGFSNYAKQNFVQTLIISFAFAAVSTCIEYLFRLIACAGSVANNVVDEPLDWSRKRNDGMTTEEHVRLHEKTDIGKKMHSIFNGDSVQMTNEAWANRAGAIVEISHGDIVYNVPYNNAGVTGGYLVTVPQICNGIKIVIKGGTTNLLITAYPIIM